MERVRQRHPGEHILVPELGTFYIGFDVSRSPFDDPRVRRAFVLATDRAKLANVILRGYGSPATGGFVPPGMPGHSAGIGLPYDPGQARQLLAEVGYSGGYGFPVVKALVPEANVPQSKYLRAQWRESLGVDIPWESMEWSLFRDRMDREPPHLFLAAWGADYPDPNNFLRESWFLDRTRWQNKVYNILVEKARRLTDQGERMDLYRQADRILVEEAPIMPLIYSRQGLLVKPWVRKYPTSPIMIEYFFGEDVIIKPH
jgi:oligopeptide transport system substrate-binding protein